MRPRAAALLLLAGLACRKDLRGEGLVVVHLKSDVPITGITEISVSIDGAVNGSVSFPPGGGGGPFDIPPERTLGIAMPGNAGMVTLHVRARSRDTELATGEAGANVPPPGERLDVNVHLKALFEPDAGMDFPTGKEPPPEPPPDEDRDGGGPDGVDIGMPDADEPDKLGTASVMITDLSPTMIGAMGKATIKWTAGLSDPGTFAIATMDGKTIETGPLPAGTSMRANPIPGGVLGEGTHYVEVTVATKGGVSASDGRTLTVDATPPTTTPSPRGGYHAAPVSVWLYADDGTATIRYTLDDTPVTDSSMIFMSGVTFTVPGMKVVRFRGTDTFGNQEPEHREVYFVGNAPTVTGVSPASGTVGTVVTVDGTDLDTLPVVLFSDESGVAGRIVSVTPTELKVQVPPDAQSGNVHVRTAFGSQTYGGEPFRFGNCGFGGWTIDWTPDPGDGAVIPDGPWRNMWAVPTGPSAEIRMVSIGPLPAASTMAGRVDLSDLPAGGQVVAVDWVSMGPQRDGFVVLRESGVGVRSLTFVDAWGRFRAEGGFTKFGAGGEQPAGVVQILGGPDAGRFAVLTGGKVHVVDDSYAETASFANGCGFKQPNGIAYIHSGSRQGQVAVACGPDVRFFTTGGAAKGMTTKEHANQRGIASLPGDDIDPERLVWFEFDTVKHSTTLRFEDLDESSVMTLGFGSNLAVSSPPFLDLPIAALYSDEAYGSWSGYLAVLPGRIVGVGGPGGDAPLAPVIFPSGAAVLMRKPDYGALAVLLPAVRQIRIYDYGSGMSLSSMDVPALAADPLTGLAFHPSFPSPAPGGWVGVLGGGASPNLTFFPHVAGEGTAKSFALAGGPKDDVAFVLDGSGGPKGYFVTVEGPAMTFRYDSDFSVAGSAAFDCHLDGRPTITDGDYRRVMVLDAVDGRIDYLGLDDIGL